MCISFPYQFIDEVTSTVSVIPHVTQHDDGRLSTSYSTITIEEDPNCDFFDQEFTWVTHGRTLTWPTTYGTLETFVGSAESTFEPTKTFFGDKDCDGKVGTSELALPSTLDPGSFIIPLGVSSPTLKAGPLPQTVIDYLDSFDTVHEQFNNIPLTSCAPALPVRTACTTVLTSTSTTVSCAQETEGGEDCVTLTKTLTETNTHTPHWPTLNGSLTDLKATAARLTTETGEATTILATAEPVLAPASDEPDSDEPASDKPASEEPASDEPASDEPASGEPTSDEPASGEPVSDEPAGDQPASDQPAEPASDEPASGEPASDEPASDEPASGEPTSDEPASGEPVSDEPAGDQPAEPASDEPTSGEPANDDQNSDASDSSPEATPATDASNPPAEDADNPAQTPPADSPDSPAPIPTGDGAATDGQANTPAEQSPGSPASDTTGLGGLIHSGLGSDTASATGPGSLATQASGSSGGSQPSGSATQGSDPATFTGIGAKVSVPELWGLVLVFGGIIGLGR